MLSGWLSHFLRNVELPRATKLPLLTMLHERPVLGPGYARSWGPGRQAGVVRLQAASVQSVPIHQHLRIYSPNSHPVSTLPQASWLVWTYRAKGYKPVEASTTRAASTILLLMLASRYAGRWGLGRGST